MITYIQRRMTFLTNDDIIMIMSPAADKPIIGGSEMIVFAV